MALYDIVKQDVLDHAAELDDVEDAAWARILAYVNRYDLSWFGEDDDTTTLLRIYLAAHIAKVTMTAVSTASGPVVSESVGGVRRTYANTFAASTSSSSLGTTRYGQQYLDILGASLANGFFLV